jgi:hypothetical protein
MEGLTQSLAKKLKLHLDYIESWADDLWSARSHDELSFSRNDVFGGEFHQDLSITETVKFLRKLEEWLRNYIPAMNTSDLPKLGVRVIRVPTNGKKSISNGDAVLVQIPKEAMELLTEHLTPKYGFEIVVEDDFDFYEREGWPHD